MRCIITASSTNKAGSLRHDRLKPMLLITRQTEGEIYNVTIVSQCLSCGCVSVSAGFPCPITENCLVSQLITHCCHQAKQMWSICCDTATEVLDWLTVLSLHTCIWDTKSPAAAWTPKNSFHDAIYALPLPLPWVLFPISQYNFSFKLRHCTLTSSNRLVRRKGRANVDASES